MLTRILECVKDVSDKEYQKRVWIRGEGPECYDFDETCCDFFDDIDPLIGDYKNSGITESQYHILKKFRDEFDTFSRKNNCPSEFIDTPEWEEITEMAKEVLRAFNYRKPPRQGLVA